MGGEVATLKVSDSLKTVLLAALVAAIAPAAHAAERVTLANGFAVECDHHAEVEGRVRLYTHADQTSYIEFRREEVASIEWFPDPVAGRPTSRETRVGDQLLTEADLHQMLSTAGKEHNLDVDLLASVVKAESGGHTHAISRTGARGLMQLMPATANDLGVQNSFEPSQNVNGGSTYLDGLLLRYHDNLAFALAAYNAGPAAVDRFHGIPPYRETRLYVARVIHEFNRRVRERQIQASQGRSPVNVRDNPGSE